MRPGGAATSQPLLARYAPVEFTGASLLPRAYVRDAGALEAAARFSIVVLLLLLPFALVEAVTGAHVLRDLAKAAFGGPSAHAMERRFGLTRAFASFDHPILFGRFSALVAAFNSAVVPVCCEAPES